MEKYVQKLSYQHYGSFLASRAYRSTGVCGNEAFILFSLTLHAETGWYLTWGSLEQTVKLNLLTDLKSLACGQLTNLSSAHMHWPMELNLKPYCDFFKCETGTFSHD